MRPTNEECGEILSSLVRINTCQPEGNEAVILSLICSLLPETMEIYEIDHGNGRASLAAKIKGKSDKGGLGFLGHVDTVACGDMAGWTYDPHEAKIVDGILYGRGAADMKGGDTAMILTARQLAASGKTPEKPIWFFFAADEENAGVGVHAMLKKGWMDDLDGLIVCEPTGEYVGFCEKGTLWIRLEIKGVASHGSRPKLGRNAVEFGMQFAQELKARALDGRQHEILGETSMPVTKLHGGIMTNIIPEEAFLEMDIRTIPGTSHEAILSEAEAICEELKKEAEFEGVTTEMHILNNMPAIECETESSFRADICRAAAAQGIGTENKGLFYYTDAARVIPVRDMPFVIAGPGEDTMAHVTNECVELESVARFTGFYVDYATARYYT